MSEIPPSAFAPAGDDEDSDTLNIYTIVEKITSGGEALPPEWPAAGTTGHDFANAVNIIALVILNF